MTGGLTEAEAAARLRRDGPNVLPTARRRSAVRELAAQMVHFFAVMLWIAGGLAFLAGLPELAIAIFVVILVNGVFAFAQEARAERAAARLRDLLPRRAVVVRDGIEQELDATALVVGDLVVLGPGDRVSADLRTVDANTLAVDTAMLTGESVPSHIDVGGAVAAGSFVVEGDGRAEVTATGTNTRLAGIAQMTTSARRPRGPLAEELDRVVRTIATIALTVGGGFFVIAVLVGMSAADGFLFAIGVTVALVPEGLLPTVTLSLAIGAQRMAARHALVRRLEAVETLGSTTIICTDKTGTLTRNEMTVVEVWMPSGAVSVHGAGYGPDGTVDGSPDALVAARRVAEVAAAASTGAAVEIDGVWVARGDPMEAAIDALTRRVGPPRDPITSDVRRRLPFDARRRRMSVVVGDQLCLKGAADGVLERCRDVPADAPVVLQRLARRGLRVVAVARRDLPPGEDVRASTADELEQELTFLGLVALEDPPREEAAAAIARCRGAGIAVVMVTGDHPDTAAAIAREVGLAQPGSPVLTGDALPDDDEVLAAMLDHDGAVVARVAPEDKLRIAQCLQRRGHVVAMTGDGVNDGPALQAADIGIAMGRSGTDVAREAADLVLLDDDFATIVVAIEHGRATFKNIRRFLTYHLTDNVAELTPFVLWALSGGRLPLALTVLQVLALDIGTDLLPALALGGEPPSPYSLEGPPLRRRLLDRGVLTRVFGVLGPTEAVMEMSAFLVTYLAMGWRPGDTFSQSVLATASGAAFAAVVLSQIANAFACRSTRRNVVQVGWASNRFLLVAVAVEFATLVVFLSVPAISDLLRQAVPSVAGGVVALSAIPALLIVDGIAKAVLRRRAAVGGRGAFDGSPLSSV